MEAESARLRVDNFVEIISAKLLNKPSISYLGNITFSALNVEKGSIFVARDKNGIQEAISRGAYAIVSDVALEIIDYEIAWILVENIDNAMLKFARFVKIMNNINIFALNNIEFGIAKKLINDNSVAFCANIDSMIECIFYKFIIINFDISLFEVRNLSKPKKHLNIIEQTLFNSTIEYQHAIFHLNIPSIFIRDLEIILHFCAQKHININLNIQDGILLPIFINSHAMQCAQSMRFIYATKDRNLFKRYLRLINGAPWGNAIVLSNKKPAIANAIYFSDTSELKAYFLKINIHFFIIFGLENAEIYEILNKYPAEQNLF